MWRLLFCNFNIAYLNQKCNGYYYGLWVDHNDDVILCLYVILNDTVIFRKIAAKTYIPVKCMGIKGKQGICASKNQNQFVKIF